MASASAVEEMVNLDDTKVVEVGEVTEGSEDSEEFVALRFSKGTLSAAPFLKQVDAYFVKEHSGAQHIVVHRASQRSFALAFGSEDLVGFGFTARDTLDDCLAILKDAYETEAAKSKGIKRTLSVSLVKASTDGRNDSIEGEVVASAAAVLPPATVATTVKKFKKCNALRVVVSEDIGRALPFEYVLLLSEEKQSEAMRYKCAIQRMANEIDSQKKCIEGYKAEVSELQSKLAFFESSFAVTFYEKPGELTDRMHWRRVSTPAAKAKYTMKSTNASARKAVALSEDCSLIQINTNAVYNVSVHIWAQSVAVYFGRHCETELYCDETNLIHSDIPCRIDAGTHICFVATGDHSSKKKKNHVTVCKL